MTTKRPHAAGMALTDDISSSSAQISHGIVAKVPSFTCRGGGGKMIAVVHVQMQLKTKSCLASIHRVLDELHICEMCSKSDLVKVSYNLQSKYYNCGYCYGRIALFTEGRFTESKVQ